VSEEQSPDSLSFELVRGVVHESNNFVGIISGYSAMIRRLADDKTKITDHLNSIDDVVEEYKQTLKWLVMLDSGAKVNYQPIASAELWSILCSYVQTQFGNTGRVRVLEPTQRFSSNVRVDRLAEVVCGIVAHALASSKAEESVECWLEQASNRPQFMGFIGVADHGSTSFQADDTAAFLPYARLSGRANPKLSLYVSRNVMQSMDGALDVTTDDQGRCVFRIWLPSPAK
jgi:signal transduction histidine kinase